MAKGQMRSGREPKKPKKSAQQKGKPAAPPPSFQEPELIRKPRGPR
jgi:hypothetical protein